MWSWEWIQTCEQNAEERSDAVDEELTNVGRYRVSVFLKKSTCIVLHLNRPQKDTSCRNNAHIMKKNTFINESPLGNMHNHLIIN